MEREILFRGISKETMQFVFGDLVHNCVNANSKIIPIGIKQGGCYPVEIISGTDGQFTGLTDKVKCRYFNGSIGTYFNNCKFVVVWDNGWYAEFIETKKKRNLADFCEETVCIGSIHDNPKLLK